MSKIRDMLIAVLLVAAAVAIVVVYQIEASNTEEVSLTKNTGGAASQMANQGEATGGTGEALPDTPLDKWLAGQHADTYVVAADGTNSTCNQCHDPINYIPSMDDMPASCTVCKFEVKPPPPLIEPANAHSVDCKVCHQVDRNGTVQADVRWLEVAAIEQYAKVSSTSQLCQNCHIGAEVEAHADIVVSGVHADLVCTDCHDSHALTASCGASGCHETLEETPGHDANHARVHCVACHDASGMSVGPDDARDGQWVTFAGGEGEEPFPHLSHALAREVNCDRCHGEALPEVSD
ncbi:MAG: hypothetical protein KBH93_03100 [Anaerolineae bacterium]|nr:hypothetical protein [Anaerolineae bacterium]